VCIFKHFNNGNAVLMRFDRQLFNNGNGVRTCSPRNDRGRYLFLPFSSRFPKGPNVESTDQDGDGKVLCGGVWMLYADDLDEVVQQDDSQKYQQRQRQCRVDFGPRRVRQSNSLLLVRIFPLRRRASGDTRPFLRNRSRPFHRILHDGSGDLDVSDVCWLLSRRNDDRSYHRRKRVADWRRTPLARSANKNDKPNSKFCICNVADAFSFISSR